MFSITRKCISTNSSNFSMNKTIDVKLNEGTIIGIEERLPNGLPLYAFKGIPYAEPPIGKLRFKPPVRLKKFSETILDCTKERSVCIHKDIISQEYIGSEDCLFLNVYTPTFIHDNKFVNNLPVMVWIHGGAFLSGSGNCDFYSPEFIVQENVIVITFNYRLGPFGFLSLPKAGIYPNAGLKDQLLVLKWVKENIHRFGGNPENVTLFGESAGAAAVHLHALSDNSKKYFHKAICQSGTSIMEWFLQSNLHEKSKKLAELLGCKSTDDIEIANFLGNIENPVEIWKKTMSTLTPDEKRRGLPMIFKPAIEDVNSPDAIITKYPLDSLNELNKINIPFIIGYNSQEGIIMLADYMKKLDIFDKDLGRLIPKSLNLSPVEQAAECQELTNQMKKFYLDDREINKKVLNEFSNLNTDYHFGIGAHLTAEIHTRKQPNSSLYFFRFSFDGELNLFKMMLKLRLNIFSNNLKGACHGDEMFYLFKARALDIMIEENSKSAYIRKNMIKLWTNFAKYGNPTPDHLTNDKLTYKWDPVRRITSPESDFILDYLEIDETIEMKCDPDRERIQFWRDKFIKYNNSFLKAKL